MQFIIFDSDLSLSLNRTATDICLWIFDTVEGADANAPSLPIPRKDLAGALKDPNMLIPDLSSIMSRICRSDESYYRCGWFDSESWEIFMFRNFLVVMGLFWFDLIMAVFNKSRKNKSGNHATSFFLTKVLGILVLS